MPLPDSSSQADACSLKSRTTTVGGLKVHYRTGGEGEPLLIVHGGSGCSTHWEETAATLANKYTVYVPDLPGYGRTAKPEQHYFIPEYVDFVDGFASAVGLDRFHLLGHSLGGGVAASFALKNPLRITKLVLVNSLCLGREIALWVRLLSRPAVTGGMMTLIKGGFTAVKWLAEAVLRAPFELAMPFSTSVHLGAYISTLNEQSIVLLGRLSELVMPTLVIWGARDPIVPSHQAYAAARVIPDCMVRVFEKCGHSVYRQNSAEFSSLLSTFLG